MDRRCVAALAACVAVGTASCTGGAGPTDGDAVLACQGQVPAVDRSQLRTTVVTDAPGQWYVRLWTDTPKDQGRPVDTPNYVCVASDRAGQVSVDSFARARQQRGISVPRLCEQLIPDIAAVSAALVTGQDAGPQLLTLQQTLPDPLPSGPERLARALRLMAAEAVPAARAFASDDAVRINSGDLADWPGHEARVRQACQT